MKPNVLCGVVVCGAFAQACADEVQFETASHRLAIESEEADTEDTLPYPEGPYGVTTGSLIKNLVIHGYVDDDGDTYSHNDTSRDFELAEYFNGTDTEAKVIMLNISVSWCGPCQQEAKHLREAYETYQPQGARIYTIMLDNLTTTNNWAKKYELPFPVLADEDETTQAYLTATQLNMFIDPSNMKILKKVYGAAYESSLEYYLENL